jgi:hypothetical protein
MNFSANPVLLKIPLVEVPLLSFPYSLIGETKKGIRAKLKCIRFLLKLLFEKKEQCLHCEKSHKDETLLTVDINLRTKIDAHTPQSAAEKPLWKDKISSLMELVQTWRSASVLRRLKPLTINH